MEGAVGSASGVPPTPSGTGPSGVPGTPRSQLGSGWRGTATPPSQRRAPPMSGAPSDGGYYSAGGGGGYSGAMSGRGSTRYSTVDSTVIWGTDIVTDAARSSFSTFLQNFCLESTEDAVVYPHYMRRLQEIQKSQNYNLNIDCSHLVGKYADDSWKQLYVQLIKYPAEIVEIIDMCVHEEFMRILDEEERENGVDVSTQREQYISVRIFNLKKNSKMRALDPSDISTLVSIQGMVTRTSDVIPSMSVAFFRCLKCGESTRVANDRGRIEEPNACDKCSAKFQMELVHNRCEYIDKQLVKLQETPENIPEVRLSIHFHSYYD